MTKFVFLVVIFCFAFTDAKWVREMENPGLFQGDMVLTPSQKKAVSTKASSFGSIVGYRWPGGVVPYVIHSNIGVKGATAVRQAIADYHKFTCLKFVQRTNQREYIHFMNGRGCSSAVGYNNPSFTSNGVNELSLAPGCRYKGIVMHEIGHSIGLYHEQSRPDRDNYVRILKHNLYDPNMGYNFDIAYNTNSLGFTYDYRSMMHYDRTAFGCDRYGQNCKETIQTLDPAYRNIIGKGEGFSQGDIDQINKMYNCKKTGGTGTGGTGTGGSSDCVDKDKDCAWWAGNGECDKDRVKVWMLENCKKSCAQVNGDKDKDCSYWARNGECQSQHTRNWMLANCKKSCNVC